MLPVACGGKENSITAHLACTCSFSVAKAAETVGLFLHTQVIILDFIYHKCTCISGGSRAIVQGYSAGP